MLMGESNSYVFGPVPSRRLGLSLGVDIVPFKSCTLNCIYCQLGRADATTVVRKDYVPIEAVLDELKERLAKGLQADFITISGSGEPTLNVRLGELIEKIKEITDIPVAVLTNGTLFYRADVRSDCAKADVVLPSLDAGDEAVFEKINRPDKNISFEKLMLGLIEFRKEFGGQIWLEIFLLEGVNTTAEQIKKIKNIVKKIRPDKVQLNTAVRPTAEPGLEKLSIARLEQIADQLGQDCSVTADFASPAVAGKHIVEVGAEKVLSILKRRPCSIDDVCAGLGISHSEALKYISSLESRGVICSREKGGTVFFKAD
jgi:wyosine [tRNA(Phe)-imidazoG37] synthetase (radical SAM superfamily)